MSVKQRKDGYWLVYYRNGNGKSTSKSFGKGEAARKAATEFDLEIKLKKTKGEALPLSRNSGIYFDELVQEWVNYKRSQDRKIEWLKNTVSMLKQNFVPILCRKPAHMITQADILYIVNRHYSNSAQSTRNRYVGYIKSIFEYGIDMGYLNKNPLERWQKGREGKRDSKLTMADFEKLMKASPPHLQWILTVAWNIPVRPGDDDLFSLKFEDVDFDKGNVRVYHTKVSKQAIIPLQSSFLRHLRQKQLENKTGYLIEYAGKPIKQVRNSLKTAAKKAGLPYEVCLYDLRHLWITTKLDEQVEMSTITYRAGTSTRMIVKNYYEAFAARQSREQVENEQTPSFLIPETEMEKSNVVRLSAVAR